MFDAALFSEIKVIVYRVFSTILILYFTTVSVAAENVHIDDGSRDQFVKRAVSTEPRSVDGCDWRWQIMLSNTLYLMLAAVPDKPETKNSSLQANVVVRYGINRRASPTVYDSSDGRLMMEGGAGATSVFDQDPYFRLVLGPAVGGDWRFHIGMGARDEAAVLVGRPACPRVVPEDGGAPEGPSCAAGSVLVFSGADLERRPFTVGRRILEACAGPPNDSQLFTDGRVLVCETR